MEYKILERDAKLGDYNAREVPILQRKNCLNENFR